VGQPTLAIRSGNPNVVEGREFWNPWSVAVDRSSTPPALYVSDTRNHRVLGWRNATSFSNGAAADIVVGQVDKLSTTPLGPGSSRPTGLNTPGAIAVDTDGNLYVVDSANNRILRYAKPFEQVDEVKVPNMVIGQSSFAVREANAGGRSERTVAIAASNAIGRSGLAFDTQGNLFFSDPLNHRVLRYPKRVLDQGASGPAADMVLGQADFLQGEAPPATPETRASKNLIRAPSGLAVDNDGRLYVADELSRVLVFTPPLSNSKAASRIMGLYNPEPGQTYASAFSLLVAEGVFMVGNRPAVVDSGQNRILIYDPYPEWPAEDAVLPSPPARIAIGQPDFGSGQPNRGQPEASELGLVAPLAASYSGSELFVADTGNNRVLVYPQLAVGAGATRVLGQVDFNLSGVNSVEGKELFLVNPAAGNLSQGGGVAVDNSAETPHLYVADTFNNRVLGYRDARTVRAGDKADIVIGQSDLNRVMVNAPQNVASVQTSSGLFFPTALAVDRNGDLVVADSGNARVLRFASPFRQENIPPAGERYTANLVLGQSNFSSRIIDASSRTMAYPNGLAFTVEGHLLVSDAAHNRVLFFRKPAGGDFTNGMAAEKVIGQPDFFSVSASNAQNRMNTPGDVATDTDDRLYVADTENNRVLVYDRITTAATDPAPAFILTGLNRPQAVHVSPFTGEIWVANSGANRATRFRRFERLALDSRPDYEIPSAVPLALTQDASGNLYTAEGVNRLAIFYNGMSFQTAGNYSDRALSPGTIGIVYPRGQNISFGSTTQAFNELPNPVPLPIELAGLRLLVNDAPAPLYFVSPLQINFLVPMNVPTSGTSEYQVVRASTGEILGAGTFPMAAVSPALFVQENAESGQVAALNENNSVNTPENPAARGSVVQIFGTGQGIVSNAPPDGTPPSGPVSTNLRPRVLIGTDFVPDENILYSGLAPSLVGVWQINVRIPQNTAPSGQVDIVVQQGSVNSNFGTGGKRLRTTIAVN
jgi:uncharacterized protein (TIGR03437 family)